MSERTYQRDEPESARLDRNFGEMLQEVRIAQAGVQILFAFLLSIPFQSRFEDLTQVQHGIYVATLLSAAISVILFTAPVATHRVVFRRGVKDFIVRYTGRLVSIGLVSLGAAVIGGTVLVLDVVTNRWFAFGIGAGLAAAAIGLWLVAPLGYSRRSRAKSAR